MAIAYSFTDNVSYGTDDINAIARDLTGAGIAPFPTQDTYSTSDLNSLTSALVSSGASLGGCLCTKTDNVVKVAQGIIFFENGVRMKVDEDGYEITVTEATAGYVYAYFNTSLQSGDIEFATELPSNGEVVLLAEITAEGTLTDRRTFARSRIATFGANATQLAEFSVLTKPVLEGTDGGFKISVTRRLENVDLSKFNYAYISFMRHKGFYDLNAGKFVVRYEADSNDAPLGTASGNTTMLANEANNTVFYVEKRDNALVLIQKSGYTTDTFGAANPVTVILI